MQITSEQILHLSDRSAQAAALLRALANEQRLLILCHLSAAGELSVSALGERINLSQSALSQHLARLRDQGIVSYRRDAQTLHYHISDPNAVRLLATLHAIYCPEL